MWGHQVGDQGQARRSALFMDLDEEQRDQVSFFSAEARARRAAVVTAPSNDRSAVGHTLRDAAPWFVGLFSYLISYGLLLTFGVLALLGMTLGFATLPSPGDALFGVQPTSEPFSFSPTPTTTAAGARATTTAVATKNAATAQSSHDSTNLGATLRLVIRVIVFGAAFLAIWPGWLGASVAKAHFERTRSPPRH